MAQVEAFVWHDREGKIVAVGYVPSGVEHKIDPVAKPGHKVLTLAVAEEHLRTLHQTHRVDVSKSVLYCHSQAERH